MGERVLLPAAFASGGAPLIASPFQFAVDGADNLRVRGWIRNEAGTGQIPSPVLISFRSVDRAGGIQISQRTLTPTNDGVSTELFIALAPGFIQNLTVTWAGPSVFTGLCYVTVDLVRGLTSGNATLAGQLIGGYIRPGAGLAWPGSPVTSSVEGRGFPREVNAAILPLGVEVTISQPLLTRWCVRAAWAVFVTSAVVANRLPQLIIIGTSGNQRFRSPAPSLVAANSAVDITWLPGVVQPSGAPFGVYVAPLSTNLITEGNCLFSTATSGLDPGDQYTQFRVMVDEWLEANV